MKTVVLLRVKQARGWNAGSQLIEEAYTSDDAALRSIIEGNPSYRVDYASATRCITAYEGAQVVMIWQCITVMVHE